MTTTLHPTDLWLVPGSHSLEVFLPDLAQRHASGEVSEDELHHLIERRLLAIVIAAMEDLRVLDRSLVEDLVQELRLRLATMRAAERFDPKRARPITYLHGIARTLVREQYMRRQRPQSIATDCLERINDGETLLERAVRLELYQQLYGCLDQLSNGELRAIIHVFGPINGYSPPKVRRRLRNPEALSRAVALLQYLGAQSAEQ